MGFFNTNGTVEHGEIVCTVSKRKKSPCRVKACKHHVCHVEQSKSGVEYYTENMRKEGACWSGARKTV